MLTTVSTLSDGPCCCSQLFSSTTLILFGLRQVYLYLRGRPYTGTNPDPLLYRYVRHPIYVGWLCVFWATPQMTVADLVTALATTAYILIAISWESECLAQAVEHIAALAASRFQSYPYKVSEKERQRPSPGEPGSAVEWPGKFDRDKDLISNHSECNRQPECKSQRRLTTFERSTRAASVVLTEEMLVRYTTARSQLRPGEPVLQRRFR